MSQFWHGHWTEDAYSPVMLGNWEVPNWHPKWPCRKHCKTTTILVDNSGRLLPDQPRPKTSPWGNYKGTWQLPLKIDRNVAKKLSEPPQEMIAAWQAHQKRQQAACKVKYSSTGKTGAKTKVTDGKAESKQKNDTQLGAVSAETGKQN